MQHNYLFKKITKILAKLYLKNGVEKVYKSIVKEHNLI